MFMFTSKRMRREVETIEKMIHIYCRHKHGIQQGLCNDCAELLEYASKRLKYCPFQEKKTTCGKCPVHCYKADMRDKIRDVMRYVGPKMLLYHPVSNSRYHKVCRIPAISSDST